MAGSTGHRVDVVRQLVVLVVLTVMVITLHWFGMPPEDFDTSGLLALGFVIYAGYTVGALAEVLEIIAPPNARIVGVPMRRLSLPRGVLLAAILKQNRVVVPHGDDVVEAGDRVVVLCTAGAVKSVARLFKERAL